MFVHCRNSVLARSLEDLLIVMLNCKCLMLFSTINVCQFQYSCIFLNFLFRKLDPKLSEEDIDNLVSSCAKSVYSVEIDEKKCETKVRHIIKLAIVE